jgi:hypothetical protein
MVMFIARPLASGRIALADDITHITKNVNNKGINVQTDTNQKQDCETVGGSSGIAGSCHATSTDRVNQSGGELRK